MPLAAVITADIVNSTQLKSALQARLIKSLGLLFSQHGPDTKVEFYRGDSFQVYLRNPEDALLLVLQSRILAREAGKEKDLACDIRACIGLGNVTGVVRTLGSATGAAFVTSGRGFEELKESQRLLVRCEPSHAEVFQGLHILSRFTDFLFHQLTAKQATVVGELLKGGRQQEVADRLKKSQSTINRHSQAAGWPEVSANLDAYQSLVKLLK